MRTPLALAMWLAAVIPAGDTTATSPALLAAAPPRIEAPAPAPLDTLARVPGSALRLGWSPERASSLGAFRLVSSSEIGVVREGDVRWFGGPARATLTYREGRLAEVRLASRASTPRLASYVPDELRRQGYRRVGGERIVDGSGGQWTGPARIQLTVGSSSIVAQVSPRDPALAPTAAPLVAEKLDFTPGGADAALPMPVRAYSPPDAVRPREAVDAGVFGRVTVRADVDTSGAVTRAVVDRGIRELSDAAVTWAAQVRFERYLRAGRPCGFTILIPVAFLPTRPAPAGERP